MPLNKNIESITERDLQDLVENRVSEGKKIEFKQA